MQDPEVRGAVWGQAGDRGRADQVAAAARAVLQGRPALGVVRLAMVARHWFREWLQVSQEALVDVRSRQKKSSSEFSAH